MKACFQIAECSLSYTKIMQTERRTTSLLDCYAEVQLIFYKDKTKLPKSQTAICPFWFIRRYTRFNMSKLRDKRKK